MIVSIAETIKHQEPERRLFLKKNDGEAENRKIRVIIPRERLQKNKYLLEFRYKHKT